MSLYNAFQTSLLNNSSAISTAYVLWKSTRYNETASLEFTIDKLPFDGNVDEDFL